MFVYWKLHGLDTETRCDEVYSLIWSWQNSGYIQNFHNFWLLNSIYLSFILHPLATTRQPAVQNQEPRPRPCGKFDDTWDVESVESPPKYRTMERSTKNGDVPWKPMAFIIFPRKSTEKGAKKHDFQCLGPFFSWYSPWTPMKSPNGYVGDTTGVENLMGYFW